MNDTQAKPRKASNNVHSSNSNLRLTSRFGPCSPAPPFKGYPCFSGQPLHRNEYGRYRPPLGRMLARAGQASGRRQAEKTRQNRALLPNLAGVKVALMKRMDSFAGGSRWLIVPKREDRQACIITGCYASPY